ncbi:hypothetical protein BY458DRAFT_73235 [Sporodiniella umbellata]|nr:hypothetical protein BY458DRAFT_73235 [Sporodiniella umbellata]
MTLYTPVIKLPKRKPSLNVKQYEIYEPNEYLVSDTLFLGTLPKNVRESDIRTLLQHCMPTEIIMDREKDIGQLRFSHVKYADRAYSLYNGFTFTNHAKLDLQMYQNRSLDPESNACLLEVSGLPDHFDDNRLYDVFRPFGPLNLCKCLMNGHFFQGCAFIQFFKQVHSDEAQRVLDEQWMDGFKLSVVPYSHTKPGQPPVKENMEESTPAQPVDIMNLYIKNLDPHISSQNLSDLFSKYGRIVSARVMTNASGQSKGYGFVSFGKPEEAAAALNAMNNYTMGCRHLTVAYHEPKKGRSQPFRPQSVYPPQPPAYFDPYPAQPVYEPVEELKELSIGQKSVIYPAPARKPIEQFSPMTASSGKTLFSMTSGLSIQPPPPNYQPSQPPKARTLRRKGSLESVMTETSASLQRTKLETAVQNVGDFGSVMHDIVDMLLTLKRKERSLCLFNPDFLKEKIDAAMEAIAACEESDESEEDDDDDDVTPSRNPLPPLPPKSKAIAIVPPTLMKGEDLGEETLSLLCSFEGKPIHEKKQLLGDKLFPLVKATGTRQAPKVTIRLLDTIDLYELAKIMFDTPLLKSLVEEAFNSL